MTVQMRRIEGAHSVLASLNLVLGAPFTVFAAWLMVNTRNALRAISRHEAAHRDGEGHALRSDGAGTAWDIDALTAELAAVKSELAQSTSPNGAGMTQLHPAK